VGDDGAVKKFFGKRRLTAPKYLLISALRHLNSGILFLLRRGSGGALA
jgi:hypothetical protein